MLTELVLEEKGTSLNYCHANETTLPVAVLFLLNILIYNAS